MDLQTVTTTEVQRNFGKFLDMEEPIVVIRDSKPEKVIVGYDDYLQMQKRVAKAQDDEFFAMLDKIHQRNAHIPYDEVVKDVDEALKYVRKRRSGH